MSGHEHHLLEPADKHSKTGIMKKVRSLSLGTISLTRRYEQRDDMDSVSMIEEEDELSQYHEPEAQESASSKKLKSAIRRSEAPGGAAGLGAGSPQAQRAAQAEIDASSGPPPNQHGFQGDDR